MIKNIKCCDKSGIESLIAKASVKLTHRKQKVFVGISCMANLTFEVRTENKCVSFMQKNTFTKTNAKMST